MTHEEARAVFLLEYCGERCGGFKGDDTCKNCEIATTIEAMETAGRVQKAIKELEELRYYHAAEIVRKAVSK